MRKMGSLSLLLKKVAFMELIALIDLFCNCIVMELSSLFHCNTYMLLNYV